MNLDFHHPTAWVRLLDDPGSGGRLTAQLVLSRFPKPVSRKVTWYRNVVGSGVLPIREVRTPIGTMDNKSAMVQTAGAPILRLSMRYWDERSLLEVSQVAPAQLRIANDLKDPVLLAREAPRLYQFLFVIWLLWFVATIGTVILVTVNGFTS